MAFIIIPAVDIPDVSVKVDFYQIQPILKVNGDGVVNTSVLLIPNLDADLLTQLESYPQVDSVNAADFPPPPE